MSASPNPLAAHYSRFRVSERLLLTGHSHQAWPDCSFAAQQQAWLDAAAFVDCKWEQASIQADLVRQGFTRLLDDSDGYIALGQNTHELVTRFLSALPLNEKPRLVTTDGEFHTIRRQLDRMAEEGIEIVKIPALPVEETAERLAASINDRTSAVLVSAVLYESGQIVSNLSHLQSKCEKLGVELLVDAYHALNVYPFSLATQKLTRAYIVGGGYKYCQLGEGVCFLRFPRDSRLRPVLTGWFSEFDDLSQNPARSPVEYGAGALRFAGATYDPVSHYRAAAVFEFFARQNLTDSSLRATSQHQIRILRESFDLLDLDPRVISYDRRISIGQLAGFLVFTVDRAGEICQQLKEHGLFTDARGSNLRLGPAPYLSDWQLTEAIRILGEVITSSCR